MGSCWNTPLPPEGDIKKSLANYGIQTSLTSSLSSHKSPGSAFSKEETKLRDLLSALRTGLLFSPTQFSVLPGVSTIGRVNFTLGNTELHKLAEQDDDDEEEEEELPEAVELNEDTDMEPPHPTKTHYSFQITLKGKSWFNNLTMKLTVWPVLGPHAGRKVVFLWSEETLRVEGCEGLNAHSLPVGFNDETEFCKCCMFLLYQSAQTAPRDQIDEEETTSECNKMITSLKSLAYGAAVCNLDLVSDLYTIPSKLYYQLFGSQHPVIVAVRLWPGNAATRYRASTTLRVKSHIVFAEFVHLLRRHFGIPASDNLKLYHNFKPIAGTELISEKHHKLDCFVISHREEERGSLEEEGGSLEGEFDLNEMMVVSLVGNKMQNMEIDLEMSMKEFNIQLRSQLSLKHDSFLVIVSEDDFSPQYTSDDSWRCTYPFNVPDTSISAGLRRSFRKLSERRAGASRLTQSQRFNRNEHSDTLTPHMSAVVRLLSSDQRQFPCNTESYSISIEELYSSMTPYQLSLSQCGLHPYSIVQVFEVTGPSIPITVRLLTDSDRKPRNGDQLYQQSSTALANIMDVNPEWSISTFLQYMDTIISPGTGSKRKRLRLNQHSLDESEEDWGMKLGGLLDRWGPTWWPLEGKRRVQLTPRDIDPTEFLLIEKY